MKKNKQDKNQPDVEIEDNNIRKPVSESDYEAEEARCLAVLAENPDDAEALSDLGDCYYYSDQDLKAAGVYIRL